MSIRDHEHQWVPWNSERLTVCDDTSCGAAQAWSGGPIFDRMTRTRAEVIADLRARLDEAVKGAHGNVERQRLVGILSLVVELVGLDVDEPPVRSKGGAS